MVVKNIVILVMTLLLALIFTTIYSANAQEDVICGVYITGIGCPNCAYTDPILLSEYTSQYDNLIIIEYEIYHNQELNQYTANQYFDTYITDTRPGVPFLIFNNEQTALGRIEVTDSNSVIEQFSSNQCPLPDGSSIDFGDMDFTSIEGKVNIWTDDRVLVSAKGGDNDLIKKLITTKDVYSELLGIPHEEIEPFPVQISESEVYFKNAVKIGDWIVQWERTEGPVENEGEFDIGWLSWILVIIGVIIVISRKIIPVKREDSKEKSKGFILTTRQEDYLLILAAVLFIIAFFIAAQSVPQGFIEEAGYFLPLPVFTLFIALVDGFNPCNLFVLTFLLGLLTSASHSRKRIYIVGYIFVIMVFLIYFIFMVFWLNVFKYIGFIDPLRIAIAIIALVAGIINIKELLFFRRGVTLMIQEQHKKPLMSRIEKMDHIIKKGTLPVLIISSIVLATFSSLVELPCTAGFPIIYTAILSGKVLDNVLLYYLYLVFYNIIYVVPLAIIIGIFGWSFKGKQISKRQMQYIKFIGGLIMILLGIILLVNPSLMGMGFG